MGKTTHGMHGTPIYKVWEGMIERCSNPNHDSWKYYGARGISVCAEWRSFEQFYKDMGDRPKAMQIDRIDSELGYFKENCRWVTAQANLRNRSACRFVIYKDERMNITEAANRSSMSRRSIQRRLAAMDYTIFRPA